MCFPTTNCLQGLLSSGLIQFPPCSRFLGSHRKAVPESVTMFFFFWSTISAAITKAQV